MTKPSLYTDDQRYRRDKTVWTPIQGGLAAAQFIAFLCSLFLVLFFLSTGTGQAAAEISIMVKTLLLVTIMITGAMWEKVVFGQYLFAPAFFWEDVVSFAVILFHLAYIIMLIAGFGSAKDQMAIALVAYALYLINAGQFLLKFRLARLESNALEVNSLFCRERQRLTHE